MQTSRFHIEDDGIKVDRIIVFTGLYCPTVGRLGRSVNWK